MCFSPPYFDSVFDLVLTGSADNKPVDFIRRSRSCLACPHMHCLSAGEVRHHIGSVLMVTRMDHAVCTYLIACTYRQPERTVLGPLFISHGELLQLVDPSRQLLLPTSRR